MGDRRSPSPIRPRRANCHARACSDADGRAGGRRRHRCSARTTDGRADGINEHITRLGSHCTVSSSALARVEHVVVRWRNTSNTAEDWRYDQPTAVSGNIARSPPHVSAFIGTPEPGEEPVPTHITERMVTYSRRNQSYEKRKKEATEVRN